MENYEYGSNGVLSKGEEILIEYDNEEIKKYGHRLERNFKIGDKAILRDSRIYSGDFGSFIELKRLADTKEEVIIKARHINDDGSIGSYDIETNTGKTFCGFYPSEFEAKSEL